MNVETLWPDIELEARRLGVEAAALAAIVAVESGGQVTARVNGREEPLIRFEGHWFDRRLAGTMREQARRLGLASPRAGAVKNPISQAARWGLLGRAIDIDRAAALESTSWGIGQVMGGNWKMLGYESVEALVAEARSGPAGQLRLMANFLVSAGIVPALRRREWKAVARVYNGPAFAANAYDQKLASAYTRYAGHAAAPQPASDRPAGRVLSAGAHGEDIVSLQRSLSALGFPVAADGIYGPATIAAVRAFQKAHRLPADGIAGPLTLSAVSAALADGIVHRLWRRFAGWFRRLFSFT